MKPVRVILSCIAAFAASFPAAAAELRLHGSSTTFAAMIKPHQKEIEKMTGLKLEVVSSSTGQGLIDLAAGHCDAALVSEPMDVALEAARLGGKTLDMDAFDFHAISSDKVSFVVHPSNPVRALTFEQLRGIHTGAIKNWSEVGGPDLPIQVITNTVTGGTPTLVKQVVLRGAEYGPNCRQVESIQLVASTVAETPGAIGATNSGFADPKTVATIQTTPIRRPLGFMTPRQPSADMEKMLAAFRVVVFKAESRAAGR